MKTQSTNGAIIWEGASLIDGAPIVVIVTGLRIPSHNSRTGVMLQTYIIRSDVLPTEALKSGQDASVCNKCPLRRYVCYVDLRGVNQVWRTYQAGKYPKLDTEILDRIKRRQQLLRIGSYGDPTVAPFSAWEPIIRNSHKYTGYTHNWRECDRVWQNYLMASVESPRLAQQAKDLGWRTFRIKVAGEPLVPDEIICAKSVDENTQCEDCLLCNGRSGKSQVNIAEDVHGWTGKINNFAKLNID